MLAMRKQNFTIIYWNLWFEMQDGSRGDGSLLCQRLDELIKKYSPDAFGLNEAYAHTETGKSPVLDHLRKNGYHIHFCEFGQTANGWAVGSAIATKRKLKRVVSHSYGDNTQSKRRRFINHQSQLIEARLDFGGTEVTILVNHMCSPHLVDWGTHLRQRKGYRRLIASIKNKNLIIGGDYNETKYMASWPRTPKNLKRKTGMKFWWQIEVII
jgi:exonuclease III